MGVFAEFECAMIRERVSTGLDRARAQSDDAGDFLPGVPLGLLAGTVALSLPIPKSARTGPQQGSIGRFEGSGLTN
jgi:hypothetical protein